MRSTATRTIVILSADAVLCASLTSLFEMRGHRVSADRDFVVEPVDGPACVIVDLDRPSAPSSCQWLEQRYPGIPVIVLSGSPWAGPDAAAGLTCGYFLNKPVPALELTAMVEGLLHDQPVG
ncbi:MAG: response regulator [Candidatus Dormibacteraeota bacterium]|nr:response regulator [Candidatus Dormibacteraeota bacterium]